MKETKDDKLERRRLYMKKLAWDKLQKKADEDNTSPSVETEKLIMENL